MTPPGWVGIHTGDSLRVLISPQGLLVNQVLRAHLVSQVLWVPKVSQASMIPTAMSRMDHRGPGAGIPESPKPPQGNGPRACTPSKESQRVRICTFFGSTMDLGPHLHVFHGLIIWPLSGWMDQEIRSWTTCSPVWGPDACVQRACLYSAGWAPLSLMPIWSPPSLILPQPEYFTLGRRNGFPDPTSYSFLPKEDFVPASPRDPPTLRPWQEPELCGQCSHTQPSPGREPRPLHLPFVTACADPSDHRHVILLRFQRLSWPTGSPRSVCFLL